MSTTNRTNAGLGSFIKQKLNDYKLLVKFRLSLLVVFSAFITFLLGSTVVSIEALLILSLGGFLVTGAANALNQVIEKDFDKLMKRTSNRPVAAGRMEVSEAVLAAGLMSVLGLLLLASFNAETALLGAFSLLSYAFIYTPLKRVSPVAVWIGAIPGALPMAIGWVAAGGNLIGPEVIFLFSIQFLWQFPHFWAIAWVSYEDYSKAGFYLLPSKNIDGRDRSTALQAVFYALCLVPLSFLTFYLDISGYIACFVMLIMGLIFLAYAINLYRDCTEKAARKLMFASFVYLPIVLIILVLDKI
ncbi:MAG: heme o synthase [Saprospiraceae bacterium]|nr:heme o synthase [Saprospiraceae bacterium]